MRYVVTGLMMLAGAVVREQGQSVDDVAWRKEAQPVQADVASTETAVSMVEPASVVAGSDEGEALSGKVDDEVAQSVQIAPGEWDVACNRKQGSALVFDRRSVRGMGGETLFRWAAPSGTMPETSDTIYTGVADCRAKSIEASWPGKRTATRAGTCGRLLVDAVCTASAR